MNIVLAAAVGNAITASKVTARKNLGISSSTVLIVNKRHLIPTITRENNLNEILEPTKVSIYN